MRFSRGAPRTRDGGGDLITARLVNDQDYNFVPFSGENSQAAVCISLGVVGLPFSLGAGKCLSDVVASIKYPLLTNGSSEYVLLGRCGQFLSVGERLFLPFWVEKLVEQLGSALSNRTASFRGVNRPIPDLPLLLAPGKPSFELHSGTERGETFPESRTTQHHLSAPLLRLLLRRLVRWLLLLVQNGRGVQTFPQATEWMVVRSAGPPFALHPFFVLRFDRSPVCVDELLGLREGCHPRGIDRWNWGDGLRHPQAASTRTRVSHGSVHAHRRRGRCCCRFRE